MSIFNKIKKTRLAVSKAKPEVVVAVPDIKEYLVKEYERVNDLKLINEGLEQQLEKAREIELKYNATLVTLDEYSKRLEQAETAIAREKEKTENARQKTRAVQDELNTHKILLNNAALTKEEIAEDITAELKAQICLNINNHKGNISKKIACEIINNTIIKKGDTE